MKKCVRSHVGSSLFKKSLPSHFLAAMASGGYGAVVEQPEGATAAVGNSEQVIANMRKQVDESEVTGP